MKYLIFIFFTSHLFSFELIDFAPETLSIESQHKISDLIRTFQIDPKQARSIFSNYSEENVRKDSLRVIDESKKVYIYPYDRKKIPNSLVKKVFKTLDYLINNSQVSKHLIQKLMSSPYKTIIAPNTRIAGSFVTHYKDKCDIASHGIFVFYDSKKSFKGVQEKCNFHKIGASSKVNWKPVSGFGSKKSNAINLIHELYHAYDMSRGVLDHRMIDHPKLERTPIREFRAVFFENLVRKNLKKKIRKKYSKNSKEDLFLNGKQVWF